MYYGASPNSENGVDCMFIPLSDEQLDALI